jgi:long-chain acyl-CoA synthetase
MSTAEPLAQRLGASSFRSVADMWHHRVESTPEADAFSFRRGSAWETLSWRQAGDRVRAIANGLLANGLGAEQRVVILSETRIEWILADLGILCAGGATTTIYPGSPDDEVAWIAGDCGAVVAFADTEAHVAQLLRLRERLPKLRLVVAFDGIPAQDAQGHGAAVKTLAQLEEDGRKHAEAHPNAYDEARQAIGPDRLATLIYTSGTTGQPKGVMLTHDSWVYEAEAVDALGILSPADKQLLFLPLAHVFAKVLEVVSIRLGIPTVVDGEMDNLSATLAETRPTWLAAVPRIFEKAQASIVQQARDGGQARWTTFQWALDVGRQALRERQAQRQPGFALKMKLSVAERLVFGPLKQRFGGKLRFLISGAAPLPQEIAEFFHAIGLLVLEGYGLTESSAATTVNTPEDYVLGTVGKPLPGTQVRIADDGEILVRGRGVMRGYWNLQDDTAAALDAEGWLHTGDVGLLRDTGHLQITDRKKDILITSGGKNIAPAHFQSLLQARSPYVSHALLHGDRRPYCVALVTLDEAAVTRWAREKNLSWTDWADLAGRPEVKQLVWDEVERINKELPSFETVKAIAILPEDFTLDNGLLTPSQKVKRRAVEERYKAALDGLYA